LKRALPGSVGRRRPADAVENSPEPLETIRPPSPAPLVGSLFFILFTCARVRVTKRRGARRAGLQRNVRSPETPSDRHAAKARATCFQRCARQGCYSPRPVTFPHRRQITLGGRQPGRLPLARQKLPQVPLAWPVAGSSSSVSRSWDSPARSLTTGVPGGTATPGIGRPLTRGRRQDD
jgi:hypothetical protein